MAAKCKDPSATSVLTPSGDRCEDSTRSTKAIAWSRTATQTPCRYAPAEAQDPVAPYHRRVRHGSAKQKVEGNAGPAWQVVDESFQLAAVPLAPRPGIEEQEALHRDGLQRRNFHVAAASPQRAVNATDAIQPAL